MFVGIAGALLVFTGFWHATEWVMDGRRKDTWRLVPFGLVYLVLGFALCLGGGALLQIISLLIAGAGGTIAFLRRAQLDIRPWVIWTFIIIDVVIVVALAMALLGA